MALTGLTTFSAKAKLLAAQLNGWKSVLEAKFNGGISGADLGWPFTANGNLNMNGNQILRVSRFRNVYNLAEYTANIQGLFDTIAAAGGGVIYIPANTTIDLSGITCTTSTLAIVGEGESSVLRMAGGSVTDMLRLTCSGSLLVQNLKLDGNSVGSTTKALLRMSTCNNANINNCWVASSAGYGLQFDYVAAAGTGCTLAQVSRVLFSSNAQDAIRIEDCDGAQISQCRFVSNARININMAPQSTSSYIRDIDIHNNRFSGASTDSIIKIRDVAAVAYVAIMDRVSICNNRFYFTTGARAAEIEAWFYQNIVINSNVFNTATSERVIYLRKSKHIKIQDNLCESCSTDFIVIGHLGGTDATTITDGIFNVTVSGNTAVSVGQRFLIMGYPRNFVVTGNTCESGNAAAMAGNPSMIELWSVPDGAAVAAELFGTISNNINRTYSGGGAGYRDILAAKQAGHNTASAALGSGAGLNVQLTVLGNINGGAAVGANGDLTAGGDVRATGVAQALFNECNLGA